MSSSLLYRAVVKKNGLFTVRLTFLTTALTMITTIMGVIIMIIILVLLMILVLKITKKIYAYYVKHDIDVKI